MALAASDPQDRAEQMILLTERLIKRLEAEIIAFQTRGAIALAAETEETLRLANAYRHETARIKANPELLRSARVETKEKLRGLTVVFQDLLQRHNLTAQAASKVCDGLIQAIGREINRQKRPVLSYGANGLSRQGAGAPIAMNRRA